MLSDPVEYSRTVLHRGYFKCPEGCPPSPALLELAEIKGMRVDLTCCICETMEVNCVHSGCEHAKTCTACSLRIQESSAAANWGLGVPSELRDSTSCLPMDDDVAPAGGGGGGGAAGADAGAGGERQHVAGRFAPFRELWEACFKCLGAATRGSLSSTDDVLQGYLVPLLKHVVLLKTQNSMEVAVELLGDKREILDDVFNDNIPFYEYADPHREIHRAILDLDEHESPQPYVTVDGLKKTKISMYDWLTSFLEGGPRVDSVETVGSETTRYDLVDSDYYLVLAECCQCKGLASYSAQLKIGKSINREVWGEVSRKQDTQSHWWTFVLTSNKLCFPFWLCVILFLFQPSHLSSFWLHFLRSL